MHQDKELIDLQTLRHLLGTVYREAAKYARIQEKNGVRTSNESIPPTNPKVKSTDEATNEVKSPPEEVQQPKEVRRPEVAAAVATKNTPEQEGKSKENQQSPKTASIPLKVPARFQSINETAKKNTSNKNNQKITRSENNQEPNSNEGTEDSKEEKIGRAHV